MEDIQIKKLQIMNAAGEWEDIPLPALRGISTSQEIVWSNNYGLTASGRKVGTILRTRTKYTMSFPPLPWSKMEQLHGYMSLGFTSMRYVDANNGTIETEIEIQSLSGTQRSWAPGQQYYDSVVLSVVER